MKNNREIGFYWVEVKDLRNWWTIAYWGGSFWELTNDNDCYYDDNFVSIDNTKIERKT